MCGKMPEPHFDAQLSPNPGETVPKREKTSCTQDLRVNVYAFELVLLTLLNFKSL